MTPGAELNVIFKAHVITENWLNLFDGFTLVTNVHKLHVNQNIVYFLDKAHQR